MYGEIINLYIHKNIEVCIEVNYLSYKIGRYIM